MVLVVYNLSEHFCVLSLKKNEVCVHACAHVHAHARPHVEVRGQLLKVSFLFSLCES